MTIHEKAELIIKDIKLEDDVNPIHIFKKNAQKEYVSIHGQQLVGRVGNTEVQISA